MLQLCGGPPAGRRGESSTPQRAGDGETSLRVPYAGRSHAPSSAFACLSLLAAVAGQPALLFELGSANWEKGPHAGNGGLEGGRSTSCPNSAHARVAHALPDHTRQRERGVNWVRAMSQSRTRVGGSSSMTRVAQARLDPSDGKGAWRSRYADDVSLHYSRYGVSGQLGARWPRRCVQRLEERFVESIASSQRPEVRRHD
jgi:hypothetical protein